MLRLAPSHPPLWRTPTSVQFGPDAVARIDAVTPWQEHLITALTGGIADAVLVPLARQHGATAVEAERFLRAIRPALEPAPIHVAVALELPADLPAHEADALEAGLLAAGLTTIGIPGAGVPVVLVAHRLAPPHRAARLMAQDTAHLPLVLAGDAATVGPLVVPGRTACLACIHERRREADPAWPLLAAQLIGRPPVRTDAGVLTDASRLAGGIVAAGVTGASATISAGSVRRSWRAHRPHPTCLCGAFAV